MATATSSSHDAAAPAAQPFLDSLQRLHVSVPALLHCTRLINQVPRSQSSLLYLCVLSPYPHFSLQNAVFNADDASRRALQFIEEQLGAAPA